MRILSTLARECCDPLTGAPADYDPMLADIGDARIVLLGEATHGSHEFYKERAQITKRLILEKGFTAVAVEADWPDSFRVDRFVRGFSDDADATDALSGFKRFPQWMWRNADVLDFVGWLREYNDSVQTSDSKCGFYGLDIYSLHASMHAVVEYLKRIDPAAAERARERYGCFDHFGGNAQDYGYTTSMGLAPSCEHEAVGQLVELRLKEMAYLRRDGEVASDAYFSAAQNALVIRNAEEYYRTMFRSDVSSWNLRDTHMMETLVSLIEHLTVRRGPTKVVVWAHNSHIGNAQATEMGDRGELNIGQLVREKFGTKARLIGFTTYSGTVTAASNWDSPAERKRVRAAHENSFESVFHETGVPRFTLNLNRTPEVNHHFRPPLLERAIGVIYRPQTERLSHYFNARLADQFDVVIHIDQTRAVEPLEQTVHWKQDEVDETYPSGF